MKHINSASRMGRLNLTLPVLNIALCFVAISLLISHAPVSASAVKEDEEVIFFPTAASLDKDTDRWKIPIHGWIFEPEEDSIWRSVLVEELLGWLELNAESVDEQTFRRRARMFLVDNERGKQFTINIGGTSAQTEGSGPNGHFSLDIDLPQAQVMEHTADAWIPFLIDPAQTPGRKAGGRVQIVPPDGLSVVSDIDDTIKISNVLDKKELLENTFLREFTAVPGMLPLYQRWAQAGAVFHYVSASPWQLYPALDRWLTTDQFPTGSISLRSFRVKDRTFFNLFSSPEESKTPAIESIIVRYPARKFFLVGDSGEKDAEIFGDLARRYPDQVLHVFIRSVPGSDVTAKRFKAAFEGLEESSWTVFSDPEELKEICSFGTKRGSGETGKRGE